MFFALLEALGLVLLQAAWFFAPSFAANCSPIIGQKIGWLSFAGKPIDHGKTFRGKRICGKNKTYRGFICAAIAGICTVMVQAILYSRSSTLQALSLFDYTNHLGVTVLLGFLLGLGALVGDAVESFIKRQRDIAPGQSWKPWDQIDQMLGATVFALPIVVIPLECLFVGLIVVYIGVIVVNKIAFATGLKAVPH